MRATLRHRFFGGFQFDDPSRCWPWLRTMGSHGYGEIYVEGQMTTAHRVSWSFFRGDIPKGMFVCHHCDNPKCVNPKHLFLGSPLDNVTDMDRKGRRVNSPRRGESHHAAKLSSFDVAEIRRRYLMGESTRKLSQEYGVSQTAVSRAAAGRSWRMS